MVRIDIQACLRLEISITCNQVTTIYVFRVTCHNWACYCLKLVATTISSQKCLFSICKQCCCQCTFSRVYEPERLIKLDCRHVLSPEQILISKVHARVQLCLWGKTWIGASTNHLSSLDAVSGRLQNFDCTHNKAENKCPRLFAYTVDYLQQYETTFCCCGEASWWGTNSWPCWYNENIMGPNHNIANKYFPGFLSLIQGLQLNLSNYTTQTFWNEKPEGRFENTVKVSLKWRKAKLYSYFFYTSQLVLYCMLTNKKKCISIIVLLGKNGQSEIVELQPRRSQIVVNAQKN